tara:strand:- start:7 stop:609 length:603 start_codon:yes stop_codon:yes gene_type:complete
MKKVLLLLLLTIAFVGCETEPQIEQQDGTELVLSVDEGQVEGPSISTICQGDTGWGGIQYHIYQLGLFCYENNSLIGTFQVDCSTTYSRCQAYELMRSPESITTLGQTDGGYCDGVPCGQACPNGDTHPCPDASTPSEQLGGTLGPDGWEYCEGSNTSRKSCFGFGGVGCAYWVYEVFVDGKWTSSDLEGYNNECGIVQD